MAAARVADVLLAVAADPDPVGVTEVARRLGLSKAVVHRILQSLASRDLLSFDQVTRTYQVGPAGVILGSRALRDQELRRAALPVLRQLHTATGETTTVSALVGTARIYLDQVVSQRELKMMVEIGRPFPLHAGSSSKAILANVGRDLREQVLAQELPELTPRTITTRARLEDELVAVRRRGVAVSRGERQHGAGSIAAPVRDPHGDVIGSLSICGPINRFTSQVLRQYAPLVRRSADEVTRILADRLNGASDDDPVPNEVAGDVDG
ncbi:IclR family transcriptional regulator [Salsipaludibacter albus]|uniref:IclR family transcriptional regulator n=1 Tax=Salsipaludibacter albus TaxID=2849650 RepID=UPI001EE3DB59